MKRSYVAIASTLLVFSAVTVQAFPGDREPAAGRITYAVEPTPEGQLIVTETVVVYADPAEVWAAYTTAEGYAAWAATRATVSLEPGGTIKAWYGQEDGEPAATLRIVNYVPQRLLTLQASVAGNWPEVLKKDAANLYNVILIEQLGPKKTKITSLGLGYSDSPELREMMKFFERANRGLYLKLIETLEES